MRFREGDRVVYIDSDFRVKRGWEGTVLSGFGDTLEICWDKLTTGHTCAGKCNHGQGWNVLRCSVRLLKEYNLSPADIKYKDVIYKIRELDSKFKNRHEKSEDDEYVVAA